MNCFDRIKKTPALVFTTALLFVGLAGSAYAQYSAADALAAGSPVSGQTVILGTWLWDIETNEQLRSEKNDLWWQQKDSVRQSLVPRSGAGLARILTKEYEHLTAEDLSQIKYSRNGIENNLLAPGTVLGLRTAEGNFAKIRIIGYRESHDFSFDDAKYARDGWKHFVLTRPNNPKYHLELEWTLYPGKTPEL